MAEDVMMFAFVVIGVTVVVTATVGIGLPPSQRLTVFLPLVSGAGAGVAALAVANVVIADDATDTAFAAGFLVSSVVGAAVVAFTLRRLVTRVRDA